jgi:DNA-binding transcriptional LysR family regulator
VPAEATWSTPVLRLEQKVYAIYLHKQHLAARIRVFVDFLIDHFQVQRGKTKRHEHW